MTECAVLPKEGYVRISQIIGDKKRGVVGVFPVSRASWYQGIKAGKYPPALKIGGSRTSAWKVSDIRALLEKFDKAS